MTATLTVQKVCSDTIKALSENFSLSIVIPCKNEEKYIGKLLSSLEEQTFELTNTPVFIADAGSTDGTLAVIREFQERGKLDIQVIPGGLPPKGRNIGAKMCKSQYILFLDADIYLGEVVTLEKTISLALEKNLECVSCYIRTAGGNWKDWVFWRMHAIALHLTFFLGAFSTGMFIFMKRKRFEELGGFNEQMPLGDDWELTNQVARKKFGVAKTHIFNTNRRFKKTGYWKGMMMYFKVPFSRSYRQKDRTEYFSDYES